MKHSQLYITFFDCLNSPGKARGDVYSAQYLEAVYDWERGEIEDAIYNRFVRYNDFLFADLMLKLKKYNGIKALQLKYEEIISKNRPNFDLTKTLYSVTNDNEYLDMMIKIYETSKYELDKRVYVVGFQSLAKMPKVYEKLIEIYINDEDSISRNTAICGVLWADGYLKIPGYRLIRASYDEKECTEINKEKELIQEFKNENIEERKRIINSYLNGEFTLFHGF